MTWRSVANWAKINPGILRVADALGRGRGRLRWLDHAYSVPRSPHRPDLTGWERREFAAVWVGHATVLLRLGGMTILTDPVLSNRVGVGFGLFTGGPHRLVAPALQVRELPPLDLILLSHAHFDHLDRPTLSRLPKRVPVVMAEHTADLVRDLGFRRITELGWGQSARVGPITVSARPVRHWGARTFYDHHRGYCAFLLEAGRHRVMYGADTAYCDEFKGLGKVDLGIFGIGAYDPWIAGHATPEQALAMADHARAERILAMHHSTFRLSHEPAAEPMERMRQATVRDPGRLVATGIGDLWAWGD